MRILLLLFLALALPAQGQQLSDQYNLIGRMDTVFDGADTPFYIATYPAGNTSFAEIKVVRGRPVLQITGISVAENGAHDRPMLSFTLSLNGDAPGRMNSLAVLEKGRDTRHPTEATSMDGTLTIDRFTRSGGAIAFDFTATARRFVLDENYEQIPEDGMEPLEISGHVEVEIPPDFIENP